MINYYSINAADDGSGLEWATQTRGEQRELATHRGEDTARTTTIFFERKIAFARVA